MDDRAAPIVLRQKWSPEILQEIMALVQAQAQARSKPKAWKFIGLIFLGSMLVTIGLDTLAKRLGASIATEAIAFGVGMLVSLLFWKALAVRATRRWTETESTTESRLGETEVTVSERGIAAVHPLSESFSAWKGVVDVLDGPLALHVMTTPTTSLPLQDSALPDGMTRQDLRARIDHWRRTAK